VEKRESSLKSHEEIVALFRELEEIEQRLRASDSLEVPEESSVVPSPALEVVSEETVPSVEEPRLKRKRSRGRRAPVFKRQKLFEIEELPEESDLPSIVNPQSTFHLRLNEEGILCGFDQPKPKPEPLRLPFRRKAQEAGGEEAAMPSGRFGRLRARFSRKKGSSEAGSSKVSKLLGGLKGLRKNRSKN
jgi:hypothetical protein